MQDQSPTFDFWRYIAVLRRWLWMLVLAAVVAGGVANLISRAETPIYQTSARLLINQAPNSRSSVDYNSLLTSERLAKTYSELLVERQVLAVVIQRLGITITVAQLQGNITVNPIRDTQLIELRVNNPNPKTAANIANTLAAVFIEQVQQTEASRYQSSKDSLAAQLSSLDTQIQQTQNTLNSLDNSPASQTERDRLNATLTQYRQSYTNMLQTYEQMRFDEAQNTSNVTQVSFAEPPTGPISPRVAVNTVLGALIGMLLAFGIVILRESLDDTLRNVLSITTQWGLPVLGFIPFFERTSHDEGLVTVIKPRSPVAERFRSLRTSIQYASVDRPLRTLLVTSPSPGDGKTTIASNLAVVMAQGGRKVALIDGDMRRPSLHRQFNMANATGISALFVQPQVYINGTLQSTTTEGLSVMPTGRLPPNPSELLGSEKMVDILKAVRTQADLIIVDTPPVVSVTDAVVLASRVDGVLLVVQPGRTKIGACRQAIEELRRSGANIIGVVVNAIQASDARYYYSGYYHYYYYSSPEDRHETRHEKRNPLTRIWRTVWPPEKKPTRQSGESAIDDRIIEDI